MFAFLGPAGTYSEQALLEYQPDSERLPCTSIQGVCRAVLDGRAELGIVPLENLIHGPVTETQDELHHAGGKLVIIDSTSLRIEHCLGSKIFAELKPESLTRITEETSAALAKLTSTISHPQPLAQCSEFLATYLPSACQVKVASTALALVELERSSDRYLSVIAPRHSLEIRKIPILTFPIANSSENFTRFAIVSRRENADSTKAKLNITSDPNPYDNWVTSFAIVPGRDRQGLLFDLLEVISRKHQLNLLSIHSRPDSSGGFVFYLDVEGQISDPRVTSCLAELENSLHKNTQATAAILHLGSYRRAAFYPPQIRRIAIIGGEGRMGRWLGKFFSEVGIDHVQIDVTGSPQSTSERERINGSDVVFFSVPLLESAQIIESYLKELSPGQLVVENCSVKSQLAAVWQKLPPDVELLQIHTMFGEQVESLHGQNVIAISDPRSGSKAQAFLDLLYKHGALVHQATIEEHERGVAYTQALSHLLFLTYQTSAPTHMSNLDAFSTPNSRKLMQGGASINDQDPELTKAIQILNPYSNSVRTQFLENLMQIAMKYE